MAKEKTVIDQIIEPALEKVVRRKGTKYFYKSEVLAQVLLNRGLRDMLDEMKANWPEWKFDEIVKRYITDRIGHALQKRDANKIRVYECYGAGESERRWQPLRALTADTLRAVMRETRTQERQLHIKSRGYEHFLRELEKLPEGATVDQVYDRVAAQIVAGHSRGH